MSKFIYSLCMQVKKLKTKLVHYIAPNASMYTSSLMQS
nr:MAG TPA: hypothetical protein [Caudoviricetes sp.]